jgi:hypothetical protein
MNALSDLDLSDADSSHLCLQAHLSQLVLLLVLVFVATAFIIFARIPYRRAENMYSDILRYFTAIDYAEGLAAQCELVTRRSHSSVPQNNTFWGKNKSVSHQFRPLVTSPECTELWKSGDLKSPEYQNRVARPRLPRIRGCNLLIGQL